jgi:hypothetical protein
MELTARVVPEPRALAKGSDERRKTTMKVEKTQMWQRSDLALHENR